MERRPRRTAVEVRSAIHSAVRAELDDVGFANLTFDRVARRAGTSRPVLYRRYSDRVSMAVDALGAELTAVIPEPQGSLRADLIAWLRTSYERTMAIGPVNMRGILGEIDDDSLDRVFLFAAGAIDLLRSRVLEPARARGELGPLTIPDALLNVPFALLRDQTIFTSNHSPDLTGIVDDVALPVFRAASGLDAR